MKLLVQGRFVVAVAMGRKSGQISPFLSVAERSASRAVVTRSIGSGNQMPWQDVEIRFQKNSKLFFIAS